MKTNLFKKLSSASTMGRDSFPYRQRYRIGVAAFALVVFIMGLSLARLTQPTAEAAGNRPISADEAAVAAVVNPHAANAQRVKDRAFLEQEAMAHFAILNPEIANQERRKAAAVAESERLASYAILNAKVLETERLKDPAMRRHQEEAFKKLVVK